MRVLVLGGTRFLGRHVVQMLLERGHEVVLFNRGKTNPGLFPQAHRIVGKRAQGTFDFGERYEAVVDTSGYLPKHLRASASASEGATYCFISSISVYEGGDAPPDENAAIAQLPADADKDVFAIEHFGALKALCEDAVRDVCGDRALVVRPGLIVGPHDPTDRFTYWPMRVARGGTVLAPRDPTLPVQFIDVRDLAAFVVLAIERRLAGTFNCTSPPGTTLGELFAEILSVTGSDATFEWVDEEFLVERGVAPYVDLPLWIPKSAHEEGLSRVDVTRAVGEGLRVRALARTIADTLEWSKHERDGAWKAGLSEERERELLTAWRDERRQPQQPPPNVPPTTTPR
jgi:2'-hydroxyisoflavone reductase